MLYSCIRLKAGLTSIMQARICYKQISSHVTYIQKNRKESHIFTYGVNECAGQNHSTFQSLSQHNELRHLHIILIDQMI